MDINAEIVRPVRARKETVMLFGVLVLIAVGWFIGIQFRLKSYDVAKEVTAWQIDAFKDLNSDEQGIFCDLRVAAQEFSMSYKFDGNAWYRIEDAQENYLAPFVCDVSWKTRGEINWDFKEVAGEGVSAGYYLGVSGDPERVGSFLLEVRADNTSSNDELDYHIWYKNGTTVWPDSFSEAFVISSGWKEVVAYSGGDEYDRLRGE